MCLKSSSITLENSKMIFLNFSEDQIEFGNVLVYTSDSFCSEISEKFIDAIIKIIISFYFIFK